jgi:hypothetical protein
MAFEHYTLKVLVNGVYRDHLLDSPQGEVRIFYEGVYLRPKRFYVPPPPTTIGRCPPGYALLRFFIPEEINPGYAKLQFWDMPCQSDFTVGTYHIEWRQFGTYSLLGAAGPLVETHYDVGDLTPDTDYEWRVWRDVWSEWVPFRTLAPPPIPLLLQVEWREVGGTTEIINIYEEEPTYVDVEGLTPDTDHEWRIRRELEPWSEWVQFRTLPPPSYHFRKFRFLFVANHGNSYKVMYSAYLVSSADSITPIAPEGTLFSDIGGYYSGHSFESQYRVNSQWHSSNNVTTFGGIVEFPTNQQATHLFLKGPHSSSVVARSISHFTLESWNFDTQQWVMVLNLQDIPIWSHEEIRVYEIPNV